MKNETMKKKREKKILNKIYDFTRHSNEHQTNGEQAK